MDTADLSNISDMELYFDLKDSWKDIGTCETALAGGVSDYNGKSVQERIDGNKKIINIIEHELAKRYPAFYKNIPFTE